MTFIQGLQGTTAIILICVLLFIDEAGVPLPIAPNEGILVVAGIFVSTGAFPLWVIAPAAFIAMLAGMITGYVWARAVGQAGLRSVAQRLRAHKAYDRVSARLQTAGPVGIGLSRLVPGIRPYGTLVSGAAEVNLRTFLLGAIPALILWEIFWIGAGILIGLPAALLLGRFEKLLLRGIMLVAFGVAVWYGIQRIPENEHGGLVHVPAWLRSPLALLIDAAMSACVVIGLLAVIRRVAHTTTDAWIEYVAIAVLLGVVYVAGRTGTTPGEHLMDARYWGISNKKPQPQVSNENRDAASS